MDIRPVTRMRLGLQMPPSHRPYRIYVPLDGVPLGYGVTALVTDENSVELKLLRMAKSVKDSVMLTEGMKSAYSTSITDALKPYFGVRYTAELFDKGVVLFNQFTLGARPTLIASALDYDFFLEDLAKREFSEMRDELVGKSVCDAAVAMSPLWKCTNASKDEIFGGRILSFKMNGKGRIQLRVEPCSGRIVDVNGYFEKVNRVIGWRRCVSQKG